MHDLHKQLGMCWYTDSAAFMYYPKDYSKCSSPSCGHAGQEKAYSPDDRGWGDCTHFTSLRIREATACASGAGGAWQWLVVLHQRHPLDTLVSGYHSFGWTHPAAPGASEAQQRQHEERQAAVRNQSVDAYVLANAAELARKYKPYLELLREPPSPHTRVLRSRYEEMVTAFPRWLSTLLAALEGSRIYPERLQAAKAELLRAHAGTFKPDGKHKRSVLPGRYQRELKPETIAAAIHQHQDMFSLLGYT